MLSLNHISRLAITVAAGLLIAGTDIAIAPPAHAAVRAVVEVGPNRAPPALRRERRPPRPHPGWAWRAGHWNWAGGRYVWAAGAWAAPPRARAAWVPGHWAHPRGRNWLWVEGHWT
jgi:hypothetical protein